MNVCILSKNDRWNAEINTWSWSPILPFLRPWPLTYDDRVLYPGRDPPPCFDKSQYSDVIMGAIASPITSLTIVCSSVFFQAQIKENTKAPHHRLCEGNPPVTGGFPSQRASNTDFFPFDDVIMGSLKVPLWSWILVSKELDSLSRDAPATNICQSFICCSGDIDLRPVNVEIIHFLPAFGIYIRQISYEEFLCSLKYD